MLQITNISNSEEKFNDYAVVVNGQKAELFAVRVSKYPFNRYWPGKQRDISQTELAGLLTFAADEAVEVRVKVNKPFQKAVVRPLSKQINCRIEGEEIYFTLPKAGKYVLEVDTPHNALHIFYDEIKNYEISNNEKLLHFPAGVHNVGPIELQSNTTVLLDRGAVVYGSFYAYGAKNIRILGNGIIDGSFEKRHNESHLLVLDTTRYPDSNWEKQQYDRWAVESGAEALYSEKKEGEFGSWLYTSRENFLRWVECTQPLYSGTHLYACENVEIDGVTYRNSAGLTLTSAGCKHLRYRDIKTIGMWRYNSDGIDFYNCIDVRVSDCFLRNFDDCICVKGQIGWDTQNSENFVIEDIITWCDWGKSLEIGVDTVASEIAHVLFKNCDCIHHHWAALEVHCGDRPRVHDITFENVRVEVSDYDNVPLEIQVQEEDVYQGGNVPHSVIMVGIKAGEWSNDGVVGSVDTVVFKNVSIVCEEGALRPNVSLYGQDAIHKVENVLFQNVTINGELISEERDIQKNAFVHNVQVK